MTEFGRTARKVPQLHKAAGSALAAKSVCVLELVDGKLDATLPEGQGAVLARGSVTQSSPRGLRSAGTPASQAVT